MHRSVHISWLDRVIIEIDRGLNAVLAEPSSVQPYPVEQHNDSARTDAEKKISGRLMRVNHSGEVAAQALYNGQALSAKDQSLRTTLQHCAQEEQNHLAWCHQRLNELSTHRSLLNPLWYIGSFFIGAIVGQLSDRISLGFVEATEIQVSAHLQRHLDRLPQADHTTRRIITVMQQDEQAHAQTAMDQGAQPLPEAAKTLMKAVSRIMTTLSYWI